MEANTDFGALCADALQILTMFETFVESEFGRQKGTKKGMPIARRLTEQRRMHPAIAKIVSDCFYDGELTTNPKKAALYRSSAPIVGPGRLISNISALRLLICRTSAMNRDAEAKIDGRLGIIRKRLTR